PTFSADSSLWSRRSTPTATSSTPSCATRSPSSDGCRSASGPMAGSVAVTPTHPGGTQPMSVTDQLLENNEKYAADFSGPLPLPPSKHLAVLACMDARINVYGVLGLEEGEAHVIRNAGGVVTDDEIRSLAISQRLLGTKEIVLIHHTDCGMLPFTDDEFKASIQAETGLKPHWAPES